MDTEKILTHLKSENTSKRVSQLLIIAVLIIITVYFLEKLDINSFFTFRQGLILAAPIGIIAIGEVISERAGIINVGVEGTALSGGLATAWVTFISGNPWIGILGGLIVGGGLGLLHAFWCVRWRANQIVSGIAINIVAMGLAYVIPNQVWQRRGVSDSLPQTADLWILILIILAILIIAQYVLFKTLWGLRLRTTGEQPEAVDIAGWDVHKIRYMASLVNGILCGLAGAFLVSDAGLFSAGIVNGRGYMGIAAAVVGGYVPLWAFGSAYLFGFVWALQFVLQEFIPSQFAQMLPYIATVVVLAGFIGDIKVPKALGEPYIRE